MSKFFRKSKIQKFFKKKSNRPVLIMSGILIVVIIILLIYSLFAKQYSGKKAPETIHPKKTGSLSQIPTLKMNNSVSPTIAKIFVPTATAIPLPSNTPIPTETPTPTPVPDTVGPSFGVNGPPEDTTQTSFCFTVFDYHDDSTSPEDIMFQYVGGGAEYSDEWTKETQRCYENLHYGVYAFSVNLKDKYGNISSNYRRVMIHP